MKGLYIGVFSDKNMVLKLIRSQPTFTIEGDFGHGVLTCSASSPTTLNSLGSFDYCRDRGLFLQSACHAVIVRKAFFDDAKGDANVDLDYSDEFQKLGTIAFAYNDGSTIVRVFSELDMSDESRALLVNGLEAHTKGDELFLPIGDELVSRLLKNGRRTSPLENTPLQTSTDEKVGGSEYSLNPYNIALFGSQEVAELNASYLRSRGKTVGFSYDFSRTNLENMLKGNEGFVHVRSCVLGGGSYSSIDDVSAGSDFYNRGRVRGTSTS